MASNTSEWPEYHLGYHIFRAPPDFRAPVTNATIGTMELRVLRDQPGTLADILALQPDIGQVLRHQKIGPWDIFVAHDDNGLVVSSYSLHVIGLMRLGADVVLTQDRMSRQKFPDGNDPEKWRFHAQTEVKPWTRNMTEQQAGESFVYEGMLFRTSNPTWLAAEGTRFSANAVLAAVDEGRRQSSSTRNSYSLTFSLATQHEEDGNPRDLAPSGDIAAFPGAKVTNSTLQIDGAEGGFSRVDLNSKGESATWFDAALFWFPGDRKLRANTILVSGHISFINALRSTDEAEARARGLIHSIRRGW